ncbi:MAG: ligase-associated DNA damage response DEXH box helicase [Rhodospirillaceae bacterium]
MGSKKKTGNVTAKLPAVFRDWFARHGWKPHPHQLEMLAAAEAGKSALLIAPTGGGKTLSGFLASLIDLASRPREGLHTLYISPLKALAVDINRNLEKPIAEMCLRVTAETRTGDTPPAKRQRQRKRPPNILMTTPESLALMLSHKDAERVFANLACIVIDEVHAIAGTKRGDLLALALSRLYTLAPKARHVGLSATVPYPAEIAAYVARDALIITGKARKPPRLSLQKTKGRLPWSGHMGLYAIPDVYAQIKKHTTTLVFVNTRATAEVVFQALWKINDDNLPIALHHGSLARERRRKVEAAMAEGRLRAIVATSSLDLGIDWGSIDLVVQMGAPKGVSRLIQRIGRSNHSFDKASKGLLVPGNRFEVLECIAAMEAIEENVLDGDHLRPGTLDVLCQHILGMACAAPFKPDDLFDEVRTAAPYAALERKDFDDALAFAENGGYALRSYDRYARLVRDSSGFYHIRGPRVARQYRMNAGVIVESPMIRIRLKGRGVLGEVEEFFIAGLVAGDTFMFSGQVVRFEGIRDGVAVVAPAKGHEPQIPSYMGGRLPLTTNLADRVQGLFADPKRWPSLPPDVREWLEVQSERSALPQPGHLLVETFPRSGRWFTTVYGFAGRNAHQTLGMLLSRRMYRLKYKPMGFIATDYGLSVWSLEEPTAIDHLFDQDILGDELEEWITDSNMMKRMFRNVAVIAGLIERVHPGQEKSGRQVTFSSDLIYDVLRKHEPNHILLRAARSDALGGLIDLTRLSSLLQTVHGRIIHRRLTRVSPLALPVLLNIGKEGMGPRLVDELLDDAGADLVSEAMTS